MTGDTCAPTNHDLVKLWRPGWDPLFARDPAPFRDAGLPPANVAFVAEVGLPAGSPPFLSFGPFASGELQLLADFGAGYEGARGLLAFGSDGGEGHVCLGAVDGCVWRFKPGSGLVLMNTSLRKLVASLYHFQVLVDEVVKRVGVYLPSRVLEDEALEFIRAIDAIDASATERGTFWRVQFEEMGG